MAKTIPVLYRNGVLVPQVELEGFEEGERFDVQVPDVEEMELLAGDGDEPWVGFISTEDALETVERTAGSGDQSRPSFLTRLLWTKACLRAVSNDVLQGRAGWRPHPREPAGLRPPKKSI